MNSKSFLALTKDPVSFALGRLTSNVEQFPNFRFNRTDPSKYELIDIHSLNDIDLGTRRATLRALPGAEAVGEVDIEWSCIKLSDVIDSIDGQHPAIRAIDPGNVTMEQFINHVNMVLNINLGPNDIEVLSNGPTPVPMPYTAAIPVIGGRLQAHIRAKSTSPYVTGDAELYNKFLSWEFSYNNAGGPLAIDGVACQGFIEDMPGATYGVGGMAISGMGQLIAIPNSSYVMSFSPQYRLESYMPFWTKVVGVVYNPTTDHVRLTLSNCLDHDFPYELVLAVITVGGDIDGNYQPYRLTPTDNARPHVISSQSQRLAYKDYSFVAGKPASFEKLRVTFSKERWDWEPTILTLNPTVYENEIAILQDTKFSFTADSFSAEGATVVGKQYTQATAPSFDIGIDGEFATGKIAAFWDVPGIDTDGSTGYKFQFFSPTNSLRSDQYPSVFYIDGIELSNAGDAVITLGTGEYQDMTIYTVPYYVPSGRSPNLTAGIAYTLAAGRS